MKLKHIALLILAAFTFAVGCEVEADSYLDEVKVSSSYVAIPMGGGSATITVTATDSWRFADVIPITIDKNTTYQQLPEWLTASTTMGNAGETNVTFSANSTLDGRSAELQISCAGKTQYINIIQGLSTVSPATVAEVMAGPESKTYRVTGICTKIANTSYGNWYMNDGTSDTDLYIYGTVNSSGAYDWSKFNIEVGDEVTVEGPKTLYGSTVELVDATFISVNKSLIKVNEMVVGQDTTNVIPIEGGKFKMNLMCKGNGVKLDIPADAQSWLQVTGITTGSSSAVVYMVAEPNLGGDRETTLTFTTSDGKKDYTAQYTVQQTGSIIDATIAEFNAAEVGTTQYRISGIITKVDKADFGNVHIKDYTGETYVYGIGAKGFFPTTGLEVGDIITVIGTRGAYGTTIEMLNGQLEDKILVEDISLADFKNLPDDKNALYRISGTVGHATDEGTKFDLDKYGNFGLIGEDGTNLYVYGVYTGWGAPKTGNPEFKTLGVNEGDKITIIAYKTSYKGLIEAVGYYVSHEKGAAAPSYKKAAAITSGKSYLMVADSKVAGLLDGKSYGYLSATDVTIADGVITGDYEKNEVVITSTDGGYLMCMEGMYLYQSGTYNSFNWSASPSEGQVWSFEAQSDGSFKVTNNSVSKWIQLDSNYGTWGSYNSEKGSYPTFYEKQ